MKKYFIIIILLSFASIFCGDEEPLITEEKVDSKASTLDGLVKDVMEEIPSPMEIATIVKNSGVNFSKDILNDPEYADDYTTTAKKALNLGIYSADLGCVYIYGKTHLSITYIKSVQDLADDLKVGQFFQFDMLKRMAETDKNVDSMLHISTRNFETMNDYMKARGRGLQSFLILVGGWVESLHLALNLTSPDNIQNFIDSYPQLVEKIGEQKNIVDRIALVMSLYEKEPGFTDFTWEIKAVQREYEDVRMKYKYEDPEMKEVDGVLVIDDKSISSVEIDPNDIKRIATAINKLRAKLINTKK